MINEVKPEILNIDGCLQGKKYLIDFYQREYVWTKDQVIQLLEDIWYYFGLTYNEVKKLEKTPNNATRMNWYYLNSILTNIVDSSIYIVDGQQRLSTLTLISLYLYKTFRLPGNYCDILKRYVISQDVMSNNYNIDSEKRKRVMDYLCDGIEITDEMKKTVPLTVTENTILNNYTYIKEFFNKKIKEDDECLQFWFTNFFMYRIGLINVNISDKKDVQMIFESINDSGKPLDKFEIIKGKILGALDKVDLEDSKNEKGYLYKYESSIQKIVGYEDEFYVNYFRAKFANNTTDSQELFKNYEKYVFADNEMSRKIGFGRFDENRIENIKRFINDDLIFYSSLYYSIKKNPNEYEIYNELIEWNLQYLLVFLVCNPNMNEEEINTKRIELAKELNRFYILLLFNGVYKSNEVIELTLEIIDILRKPYNSLREIFDSVLKNRISGERGVPINSISHVLEYRYFEENARYEKMPITPTKFVYAMIDKYICDNTGFKMVDEFKNLVKKKKEYHREHLLAHNDTNLNLYNGDPVEFENSRSKFGGLVLMLGIDNESSNADEYSDKLKAYEGGTWFAKTLCEHTCYANHPRFRDFNTELLNKSGLQFRHMPTFTNTELNERNKLIFKLVQLIWDIDLEHLKDAL